MSATLTFVLAVAILFVVAIVLVIFDEIRTARRFDAHADAAIDLTGGAR